MQIQFADTRPDGDYALALPSAGSKRPGADGLADKASVEGALKRQRFEGDSGSLAELFVNQDGAPRRLLIVGTGADSSPADSAEKLGSAVVARLLTSGETAAVIDLSGFDYDADAAAKVALGAALRAWRYDRYRTKLKEKQKPTLKTLTIVGGGEGAAKRWSERWEPVYEGIDLTRSLVTEPANIIYPESFVERCRELTKYGLEMDVLDGEQMKKLGMGALLGVAQGSIREPRLLILRWNGGKQGEAPVAFGGQGGAVAPGGLALQPAGGLVAM